MTKSKYGHYIIGLEHNTKIGHPTRRIVSKIIKDHNLPISNSILSSCSSCHLGKLAKLSFTSVEHTTNALFQIVHSDVWGPAPILSNLGFSYFVLFVDILLDSLVFIFLKIKVKFLQCLKNLRLQFKDNLILILKLFILSGEVNIRNLIHILNKQELFTELHVLTHMNKMEFLNAKLDILLIIASLYQLMQVFLFDSDRLLFKQVCN